MVGFLDGLSGRVASSTQVVEAKSTGGFFSDLSNAVVGTFAGITQIRILQAEARASQTSLDFLRAQEFAKAQQDAEIAQAGFFGDFGVKQLMVLSGIGLVGLAISKFAK